MRLEWRIWMRLKMIMRKKTKMIMMTFKRNSICCQTMTNQILASTLKAKKTQSVAKSY